MSKVIELKGKNIIDAYDGYKLSKNFGYSCANIHITYDFHDEFKAIKCPSMQGNNIKMFDIFTENPNNISCFVYINDNNEIEGRRMFFKGKQLLDHKVFNIITKLNSEIYYLYGYYGNYDDNIEGEINKKIINKYGDQIIYVDNGIIKNGNFYQNKHYWIMQIDKMNFNTYPPIDYLYQSTELKSFSNFKPHKKIIKWLENTYNINNVKFKKAYRYGEFDKELLYNWNRKF